MDGFPQLVVVVDELHDPVDRVLKALNVDVVLANHGTLAPHHLLHLFLSQAQVINCKAELAVLAILLLQVSVHALGLILKLVNLELSRRDVSLQVLDLVVKHKFELFKFLGLLLQEVDVTLSHTDLDVFLSDLLLLL